MIKVEWFCDRCGKLISGSVRVLSVHYYDSDTWEGPEDEEEGAHLCALCFDAVDDAVAAAIYPPKVEDPVPTEAPKPKKVKAPANKVKLDLGKIAALRRAGWTLEKIGQEMHCSPQTIANHMDEAMAFLANTKGENDDE